jgi:uncharacterized protein (TIRG00374 family)
MKLDWRSALGLALSAALLWWTLKDESAAGIWAALRGSNLTLLLVATVVCTLMFPLRALRWRSILQPVAGRLPYGPLWRATCIGMMVNNVVPARAGELARAYALSREVPRVPFSASFASLAVDRVFDALVVLILLLVAMLDPLFPAGTLVAGQPVANWAGSGVIVLVAALVVLYLVVLLPERLVGWYELFARRVSPGLERRGRDALLAFASGLGVLRRPTRFAAVLAWTLLGWLVNALAFWIGFKAVGIDAPFSAALFLQGIIAIGVAVPAAPGFFGVFEALAKAALGVYGVEPARAVSWAVSYHLLTFVPITAIGAVYFARLGLHFRELQSPAPAPADAAPGRPSAAPSDAGAP